DLPDNVTISIVRHGKDPANITVTRGDQKWDTTEKDLDKLPEDLRPHIQRMIGGLGPVQISMPRGFNMTPMHIQAMPPLDRLPGMNPPPRDGRPGTRSDGNRPRPPEGDDGGPPSDRLFPPGPRGSADGRQPPMMDRGSVPPELMERLDRLDQR